MKKLEWRTFRFYDSIIIILLFLILSVASGLAAEPPEEPDYFFLTGGPYTQQKGSPQIIWANQWSSFSRGGLEVDEYVGGGRFEMGLTNRWELDFEFGALKLSESVDGVSTFDESGWDDLMLGIRYRLLDEADFPFTLTLGPQIIYPTASSARRLGTGEVGYAVDITGAKDWGGDVFLAASLNLSWTPGVEGPVGTGLERTLGEAAWAMAFAYRAMEKPLSDGRSQDIHLFFEVAGSRFDEFDDSREIQLDQVFLAPGFRYGYISSGGSLTEIGVSVPIGLNTTSPDWGVILQVQFELPGSDTGAVVDN